MCFGRQLPDNCGYICTFDHVASKHTHKLNGGDGGVHGAFGFVVAVLFRWVLVDLGEKEVGE